MKEKIRRFRGGYRSCESWSNCLIYIKSGNMRTIKLIRRPFSKVDSNKKNDERNKNSSL